MADSKETIVEPEQRIADYERRIAQLENEIGWVNSLNETLNQQIHILKQVISDISVDCGERIADYKRRIVDYEAQQEIYAQLKNEIVRIVDYEAQQEIYAQLKNEIVGYERRIVDYEAQQEIYAQLKNKIVAKEYSCALSFHVQCTTRTIRKGFESKVVERKMLVLDAFPSEFAYRYGERSISEPIYIRKCYEELYDLTIAAMINQDILTPAMLFTGVPGIGKSMFMIYFLCRFQTEKNFVDRSFAFEVEHGKYHYYNATGATLNGSIFTARFNCSRSLTFGEVPLRHILVVADMINHEQPQCRAKWTLIFSSPNPDRYKEFMKNKPKYKFIVPTWSEEELLCVNEHKEQWYERFVVFGGVPRSIFWDQQGSDPMDDIYGALDEKGALAVEYFLKNGFGNVDSKMSYSLVHINPPIIHTPAGDKLQYLCSVIDVVVTFASDRIFQRLKFTYIKGLLMDAASWFNTGSEVASRKFGAVSAGHLFEKICLWLVPLADNNISILPLPLLPLQPSNSISVKLPPMRELDFNWKDLYNLDSEVLYQPLISNLESGDAFCVIEHGGTLILIVLQITVGEMQPIKANGLTNIVEAYRQDIRDRITRKLLIFVTPVNGKLSKVQAIHAKGNRVINVVPTEARNFEQYVCHHFIAI